MAQVQKLHGVFPEKISVLSEVVEFDADGYAEISDELSDVLTQIPGYNVFPKEDDQDGEGSGQDGEGSGADGQNGTAPRVVSRPVKRVAAVQK